MLLYYLYAILVLEGKLAMKWNHNFTNLYLL